MTNKHDERNEEYFISQQGLDTLIAQIIKNTGEELLRLAEGERKEQYGYLKGEVCNRDKCKGIIDEHEKEGCSCHMHPPCSSCVTDKHYCPICDWSGEEEQMECNEKISQGYRKIQPVEYKIKTPADLDNTKIDYISTFGGYYNYVYEGVYPEGTTLDQVKKAIGWNDYFGGVVHHFGNGKFKIKKYTD